MSNFKRQVCNYEKMFLFAANLIPSLAIISDRQLLRTCCCSLPYPNKSGKKEAFFSRETSLFPANSKVASRNQQQVTSGGHRRKEPGAMSETDQSRPLGQPGRNAMAH